MPRFIPIIGLEIHVRLKTRSKIFCRCPNVPDDTPPNTAVCPVCTGQPGALPVVNAEAIRLGVRAGLSLGCSLPDASHFDRKNYFYPDLPKGYQISQYDFPICVNGKIDLDLPDGSVRHIGITRAHLEEDAAKNIHDAKNRSTLVDFNRSGTPLLEIVTEPDLRSPAEAKTFLQELQAILRAIGASDADMEKGYMRCDANISLLPVDANNLPLQEALNPKVEVKNINSFRFVERALGYEIERQTKIYEDGGTIEPSTRGWDEATGTTLEQRSKETSADYRYFPEPDLPPLNLKDVREKEMEERHELPREKRLRLMDEYGFSAEDARYFVMNDGWADYAERVMGELAAWMEASGEKAPKVKIAKLAGGWLTNKLVALLAQKNQTIKDLQIDPENFAEFIHLIEAGTVNSANAQKLLALMMEQGTDPSHLLEEHNLGQSDDPRIIEEIVTRMIAENPDKAAQIKAGKTALVQWFIGQVMKSTEGRANPEQADAEVRKQLRVE